MIRSVLTLLLICLLVGCGSGPTDSGLNWNFVPQSASAIPVLDYPAGQYQNPLRLNAQDGSSVESCPDPSIIRGQKPSDNAWYLYCTNERFADNGYVHLLPIFKSNDLTHWLYVGDVFQRMPSWVARDGGLWAPDIQHFNGKYYLYYSVSNTSTDVSRRQGSGIFVATSENPTGPWHASGRPVVEPGPAPCCGDRLRATIDSAVVFDGNQKYIFYGSFNGGISARALSLDGMTTDRDSQVQITVPDRYEASYIVKRNGYFYLMVSAGNCCAGELSGYSVFAGRSTNALGPYVDRDGNSLLEPRVGGSPVLSMNGNRWIGPGHNAVVTDASGQDWMIYHAVDSQRPYFENSWTRRPVMMDPIDWIDGWPVVRGGEGPSDALMRAPAIYVSQAERYVATETRPDMAGALYPAFSDEFGTDELLPQWSWLRAPGSRTFGVLNGLLRLDTSSGEIVAGHHDAPVLVEDAPPGDYIVEVRLSIEEPIAGVFNFVQGGVVIYKDDNNYIKLVSVSINTTRQIEFAKQYSTGVSQMPRYGSSFLSSPTDWTYLRIVKRTTDAGETYTAYSSHDGTNWSRGSTWTHSLGERSKIGLVSMAGTGFRTTIDYVRVYSVEQKQLHD